MDRFHATSQGTQIKLWEKWTGEFPYTILQDLCSLKLVQKLLLENHYSRAHTGMVAPWKRAWSQCARPYIWSPAWPRFSMHHLLREKYRAVTKVWPKQGLQFSKAVMPWGPLNSWVDGSCVQKRAEEEEDTAATVPSCTTALCYDRTVCKALEGMRACTRTHIGKSPPIKLLWVFCSFLNWHKQRKNNLELIMLIKNQKQQLQFIKCYKPSTVLSTIITNKEQALYDIKI